MAILSKTNTLLESFIHTIGILLILSNALLIAVKLGEIFGIQLLGIQSDLTSTEFITIILLLGMLGIILFRFKKS